VTPSQGDAPTKQGDAPATQGDTPTKQDDTPAAQGDTPTKQDDAPSTQGDTPTKQDDTPAAQGDAPATLGDAAEVPDKVKAALDLIPNSILEQLHRVEGKPDSSLLVSLGMALQYVNVSVDDLVHMADEVR